MREAVARKLVVVVRERFQAPHERSERAVFALAIDDAVCVITHLLKQDAVPGVREFVELRAFAPRDNFQLHIIGQLAQLVDVVVYFCGRPPWMPWSLGDRAAVVLGVCIEANREGRVDGLHILDRLISGVLSRANRSDCVVQVRVAVVPIANGKVRRGKPRIVPRKRVRVIEVEYQPRHHPRAIDLHVGIAERVFARTDKRSGLVVAATGEIGRLKDNAV
ncbi:hypothetical protein D3C85_1111590 [compost metagenome]